MHRGYQFLFFKLDEEDNPSVYCFLEGKSLNGFEKIYDKYTDYLLAGLKVHGFSIAPR